jgi:hypothetical protein
MTATVQDVLQRFFPLFKQSYVPSVQQAKASRRIMGCKTAALGGHAYSCGECGHTVVRYNSCRNRHCPMCQDIKKAVWVDKRLQDILDAPYFHVVFTMPQELQPIIYQNQELLYSLMFKVTAETLSELANDKKYLGAQIGFFSLLHTWSQDLRYHPHIHTVVMAGGLTRENRWQMSSRKFFIPVKVLARKFRGKFLHYLNQYYLEGRLHFYGAALVYQDGDRFAQLFKKCYAKEWYVYTKRTFSGPVAVVRYLGQYTHRIAISNNRVVGMDKDKVSFTVKDREHKNRQKTMTVQGTEFVRRFLMHILPRVQNAFSKSHPGGVSGSTCA